MSSNLVSVLSTNPDFSSLALALKQSNLLDSLGGGHYTIFAPNNQAFSTFLNQLGVSDLSQVNPQALDELLKYHVSGGNITSLDSNVQNTLSGKQLSIKQDMFSKYLIGNDQNGYGSVTVPPIVTSNGEIYPVNKVLVPPGFNVAAVKLNQGMLPMQTQLPVQNQLPMQGQAQLQVPGVVQGKQIAIVPDGTQPVVINTGNNGGNGWAMFFGIIIFIIIVLLIIWALYKNKHKLAGAGLPGQGNSFNFQGNPIGAGLSEPL